MFSRMRRLKGVQIPLRVRGASNPPDDDQGIWVYDRFVNEKTKEKGAIFIPAGIDDNPFLDKESYEKSLENLDVVTRTRLRDGVWTIKRKGNLFRRDWFEIVDVVPATRRKVRFWDMAATDSTKVKNKSGDPDYTVGALVSEANGIYYIEDIVRVRKSPSETQALQRSTALSDGPRVRQREEQEPGSSGISLIDMKAKTVFKGFNYKGIKSTGSKADRANALSAASERGHVKILRTCRNIEEFFDEAEGFPGGLHDDIVDAVAGGFNELGVVGSVGEIIPVGVQEQSFWGNWNGNLFEVGAGYWNGLG